MALSAVFQGLCSAVYSVMPYADSTDTRKSAEQDRVEGLAHARFGNEAIESARVIADGLIREIPSGILSDNKKEQFRKKLEEMLFRVMGWSTDKFERLLPDISESNPRAAAVAVQARRDFGVRIAGQFEEFARHCEEVSDMVQQQKKLNMSSGKVFIDAFNLGINAHDSLGMYADENRFYDALKDEVYRAVRRELRLGDVMSQEIHDVIDLVCPDEKIKHHARELLLLSEKSVTDPAFLKDSIAELFDVCSDSIETYFQAYIEQLESPPAEDISIRFDLAYGKSIMSLLRIVDPKLGTVRMIKFLEWFLGREKMLTGDDKLTRLLAEITQISIEEQLQSNVRTWTAGIIKLVQEKLFDAHHNYIERPSFIAHEEWEKLKSIPEYRGDLDNPESPLMKQLKKKYDDGINGRFQKSCIRMTQAVAVASLVFEQHLLTPRQVASSENHSKIRRFFASISDKMISLPVVRVIVELFHRCTIWIRVGLAKMIGYGAGISLAHRAGLFFESDALKLLYRKLLISSLTDLDILRPEIEEERSQPRHLNPVVSLSM